MIPGLQVGDFILVNKHSYGLKINRIGKPFAMASDPEYGDVVGLDFTARDLQNDLKVKGLPWEKSKSFDGSIHHKVVK